MDGAGGVRYVPPLCGRAIWWLGGRGVFAATGEETGGSFCWWEDNPPPGGGPVPHVHSLEEEFFYILEGEFVYQAGGRSFTATPGSLVCLPKGVPHRFRNGSTWARVLVFVAPAGNERLFLDLASADSSPEDPTEESDPAQFHRVAERYGVTLISPDDPDWESRRLPVGEGRVPTVRRPGEGETLRWLGAACVLKATGAETDGAYTLAEIEMQPGAELPDWHHSGQDVGIYILEGMPTLRMGDREIRTSAGGSAIVPRGVGYDLRNASKYPARFLRVSAPAGLEDELRSRAAIATKEGGHGG